MIYNISIVTQTIHIMNIHEYCTHLQVKPVYLTCLQDDNMDG